MSFRDPINGLLLSFIEISQTVGEFQIEIYYEIPKLRILIELSDNFHIIQSEASFGSPANGI